MHFQQEELTEFIRYFKVYSLQNLRKHCGRLTVSQLCIICKCHESCGCRPIKGREFYCSHICLSWSRKTMKWQERTNSHLSSKIQVKPTVPFESKAPNSCQRTSDPHWTFYCISQILWILKYHLLFNLTLQFTARPSSRNKAFFFCIYLFLCICLPVRQIWILKNKKKIFFPDRVSCSPS